MNISIKTITAILIAVIIFFAASFTAFAEDKRCTVTLKDGSVLKGEIVSQNDEMIVLNTPSGELIIKMDKVSNIEYGLTDKVAPPPAPKSDPADKKPDKYENEKGFNIQLDIGTMIMHFLSSGTVTQNTYAYGDIETDTIVYFDPNFIIGAVFGYQGSRFGIGLDSSIMFGTAHMEDYDDKEEYDSYLNQEMNYTIIKIGPMAQYYFKTASKHWKPFIGFGIQYGLSFWDVEGLGDEGSEWGSDLIFGLTGGSYYRLNEHWYLGLTGKIDLSFPLEPTVHNDIWYNEIEGKSMDLTTEVSVGMVPLHFLVNVGCLF